LIGGVIKFGEANPLDAESSTFQGAVPGAAGDLSRK
jgi:hypothetical protein